MTLTAAEQQEVNGYELFIAALSVISIFNIVLSLAVRDPAVRNVIDIVDTGLCIAFLADFLGRLRKAESKSGYFFRHLGWLDLLGSLPLPGLRIARIFRVARVVRLVRAVGMRTLVDKVVHDRAGTALYSVLLFVVLVIEYGAIFELLTNRNAPNANIHTASDAVWYVIVTISTVGYGDEYPVTNPGRIVGVVIIVTGVGLFGVLIGFLSNAFLSPSVQPSAETPAENPGAPAADHPGTGSESLDASVALLAHVDQLSAEVAGLRRLVERLSSVPVVGQDESAADPQPPDSPYDPG